MSDKTNNHSEILLPALRQYRRTCDDDLIPAYHHEMTAAIVAGLQSELEALRKSNAELHRECETLKGCVKIARVKAEKSTYKQRAEIGRDAIFACVKITPKFTRTGRIMLMRADLLEFASNLTANSGDKS